MKIALAIPREHTSTYITNALQDLGHKVYHHDYRIQVNPQRLQGLTGWMDALVIVKGESIPLETIRFCAKKVPTALWHFDAWEAKVDWLVNRAQEVDHFFTIAGGLVDWYQEQGIEAHWLSEGCDPNLHRPAKPAPFGWGSDVAFVGTLVQDRGSFLEAVGERFALQVWGSSGAQGRNLKHRGRAYGDAGHNKVVSSSKVILGIDRTPDIRGSWSARLYRTLAAGGFYLTNRVDGLTAYFKDGVHLLLYESPEDCLERIEVALEHPEWREEISEIGQREVVKNHTFRHRMEEMLRFLT